MAVLLSTSFFAFLVLAMGLAATLGHPSGATPVTIYQKVTTVPTNSVLPKQVAIGKPTSTLTTMTGGGPGALQIRDTVKKVIEPQPDSLRVLDDHYKKSVTIQENLKTAAKGTNVGHIQMDREFTSTENKNVVHQAGKTLTTTKGESHRGINKGTHRRIIEKGKDVHVDVFDSCEACKKLSRSVEEGKESALMKSREEKGAFTTHYLNAETRIHDANHTDNQDKHEASFKHETQQNTGTMQTVHEGKDNLMVGAMHDMHTETITGIHGDDHTTKEQETPLGKKTKTTTVHQANLVAADVQEHYMNAYHDTPLHKFIMNNKQVRDDRFREQSIKANYDTELQRKDGTNVHAHEERKTNIDGSRLQHVDELRIKAITKAHPEHPIEVKLQTKIVDRDHLNIKQSNLKNTVTTMPDGGKRTMSMKIERTMSKNLKTTPRDKNHVDNSLPLAEQIHKVEKTVVPAEGQLMTPLVHQYKVVKME